MAILILLGVLLGAFIIGYVVWLCAWIVYTDFRDVFKYLDGPNNGS